MFELSGFYCRTPDVHLLRALSSLLDGIWGILKCSFGAYLQLWDPSVEAPNVPLIPFRNP